MGDSSYSLLLVANDSDDVELIRELLTIKKHIFPSSLTVVSDITEATVRLKSNDYDAVLFDLALSDNDQALDTFSKFTQVTSKIPIIVLNSIEDPALSSRAVKLGAQDCLIKGSFSPDLLVRTIRHGIERQQLRAHLKETSGHLHVIAEGNVDGILFLDRDRKITYANPAAQTMFGCSSEELIGSPLGVTTLGTDKTEIDILDKDQKTRRVVEMRFSESEWKGEAVFVASLRDITRRKEAEEKYSNLFQSSVAAIVVHDQDGQIFDVNQKTEQLFEYDKTQLMSMKVQSFYATSDESRPREALSKAFSEGPSHFEVDLKSASGKVFPAEVSLSVFEVYGRKYLQSIIMDITERKRLERLKDDFIVTASHELRTPIASLQFSMENLADGTLGEMNLKQKETIVTCFRNVTRLSKITNNLLDMSKLELGGMTLKLETIDLNHWLAEQHDELKEELNNCNIALHNDTGTQSYSVACDVDMMDQVLRNYTYNAMKYAASQVSITLHVGKAPDGCISFVETQDQPFVQLGVKDDGPGIPEDRLSLLFNKFVQLDRPFGGEGYKGTGLGLVICKEIIRLHKGYLGVESNSPTGAHFYFGLPQCDVMDAK